MEAAQAAEVCEVFIVNFIRTGAHIYIWPFSESWGLFTRQQIDILQFYTFSLGINYKPQEVTVKMCNLYALK